MEVFLFFLPPFMMCLLLVGIHCYLGLHVLAREVIFVDLSLAQVAGLGTAVALLFHIEHHSTGSYFMSLGFTFVAAALFSWARKFQKVISQEVIIGLVYALASASVILVVDKLAHGAEHIKEILIGRILWVSWEDVIKTFFIYSGVALIHYIYRRRFLALSFQGQEEKGSIWDFLFFALFGVVITSSVGVAGILLVFALLIVPAQLSIFFTQSIKSRLVLGWFLGSFVCLLGLFLSYFMDLPAGAVLVVCFSILPIFFLPFVKKMGGSVVRNS